MHLLKKLIVATYGISAVWRPHGEHRPAMPVSEEDIRVKKTIGVKKWKRVVEHAIFLQTRPEYL